MLNRSNFRSPLRNLSALTLALSLCAALLPQAHASDEPDYSHEALPPSTGNGEVPLPAGTRMGMMTGKMLPAQALVNFTSGALPNKLSAYTLSHFNEQYVLVWSTAEQPEVMGCRLVRNNENPKVRARNGMRCEGQDPFAAPKLVTMDAMVQAFTKNPNARATSFKMHDGAESFVLFYQLPPSK